MSTLYGREGGGGGVTSSLRRFPASASALRRSGSACPPWPCISAKTWSSGRLDFPCARRRPAERAGVCLTVCWDQRSENGAAPSCSCSAYSPPEQTRMRSLVGCACAAACA